MRASPESLRRIRPYTGAGAETTESVIDWRLYRLPLVVLRFSNPKAHKAADLNVFTGLGTGLCDYLCNREAAIPNRRLFQ